MSSPRALPALIVCLVMARGCGAFFSVGAFEPIPRGTSEQPLYSQVRQLGLSRVTATFPLDDGVQTGVPLDLHNRGAQPIGIDLPAATIVATPVEGGTALVLSVVGAGDGDLRPNVQLARPPGIQLAPGQRRTIWLAFA